jgi:hypothetical protein
VAQEGQALTAQWHRWFAWRPVELVNGRFAWLRWLERRVGSLGISHEYRTPARSLGHWPSKERRLAIKAAERKEQSPVD